MFRLTLCLSLVALGGCGSWVPDPEKNPDPKPKADAPVASSEGKTFVLSAEPAGGKGVIAVRKDAKDGDAVVVVGRVGGSTKPFTENRASFLIVDPSLKPTDGCETPWDFCEYPKSKVAAARLLVKFVGPDGKALGTGARELFGLAELSEVVVEGKVSRDDKDNVVVVARRLFVRAESK